jgi:NTP pyrophosphatase (non-canonical NTP hydrolase)
LSFRCLWSDKVGPDQHRCKEQCVTCAIHFKTRSYESEALGLTVPEAPVTMDFDTYIYEARKTAIYPRDRSLEYLALGLASEAGEVAGRIKKWLREDDYDFSDMIADELGDVLWYMTMLGDELGFSLDEIMERNIAKLQDRQARDQLQGSGDER